MIEEEGRWGEDGERGDALTRGRKEGRDGRGYHSEMSWKQEPSPSLLVR